MNFNNKKVLILKLQGVGDTVLLMPTIKKIFELYPDIKLDIAVNKNGSERLLKLYDFPFNKIIVVRFGIIEYLKFLIKIIIRHYYAIILPYKSGKKENLLSFLSLCNRRIGYVYKNFRNKYYKKLFDYLINYGIEVKGVEHYLKLNLDLLKEISGKNFKIINKYPVVSFSNKSKQYVNSFLKRKKIKKYIVFHLWAGDKNRLWDIDKFKNLMQKILNKYKKISIILIGKGTEEEWNNEIIKTMKNSRIFVYRSNEVEDTMYLLKKSVLLIGNDSGIMHLASLVRAKILSLWFYTNFYATSPVGNNVYVIRKNLKCSPCYEVFLPVKCIYKTKKCLELSVERVWNILEKILENKKIKYSMVLSNGAKIINV